MLSLRATAARTTRTSNAIPTFSTSIRLRITTWPGNDSETSRGKRRGGLIDHAPGWDEELATTSEASVKADRDTTNIDDMRRKTVDYAQSHRPDPEVEQTHAAYARDEVGGPLGNSGVGEFEGVVGNDDLGPDDAQVEPNGRVVSRRGVHEKTTVRGGESGPGQANV